MAFVTRETDRPIAPERCFDERRSRTHGLALPSNARRFGVVLVAFALLSGFAALARASDHLDSPTTVANPQADIADVYAWVSPEGQRLNLVLTIQGHAFSTKVSYVIHVDSGKAFGQTSASTAIECRFQAANAIKCDVGTIDSAAGDARNPAGLEGRNQRFRVYAGQRDDPFYNNVKGLLGAYQTATEASKKSAATDAAGCAHFDAATAKQILTQMSHTDGGPAQNLLNDWTVSAIVLSVDLSALSAGGKLLAVWATAASGGKLLDRMARPFVANTLLGASPFSPDDASGVRRQEFNQASKAGSSLFIADLQRSLAFQDSLDGLCGNQFLARGAESPERYRALATMFSDDRLWVNSASHVCTQFFAVELANLGGDKSWSSDCGGRVPTYDAANVWRSLVIAGTTSGISDGLRQDEHRPSATVFPFLLAPDAHGVNH